MAVTTTSLHITQTDPLALGGRTGKPALRLIVNRLYSYLMGTKRAASIQVLADTTSTPVRAHGTIALATCLAGTIVEVNGAPFTAIAGTVVATNDEFDIDGTDAADATDLARAINASTHASIQNIVAAAAVGADILTPATAIAGDVFKVVLADGIAHSFIGVAAAVTVGALTFDTRTSNAAVCTSIAAQVNGYAPFTGKLAAADGTTIVTFTSQDGNTFTLTGTATTLAESNGGRVLVRAVAQGVLGNGVTLKTLGVCASDVVTLSAVDADDTLSINGAALTAIVQRATGTLTAATAIAGNTFAIDGVIFTGQAGASTVGQRHFSVDTSNNAVATDIAAQINGYNFRALGAGLLVTATASAAVVTIRAVAAGTAANSIPLAGTVTTLAASGTALAGGIAVANDQFDVSSGSTDAQVATDLARAVNASTTALISGHVRATANAATVTVWAKKPGTIGNAIACAGSDGDVSAATARLAGGTEASSGGAQASGTLTLATVLNTHTCAVNGVTITAHTDTQANDQFTIAGTDAADASALARAINESTTAALADVIATSSGAVVTVKSRLGGVVGNAITISAGQGTIVASGARLTVGVVPTTVVLSAERLVRGAGGAGTPLVITL